MLEPDDVAKLQWQAAFDVFDSGLVEDLRQLEAEDERAVLSVCTEFLDGGLGVATGSEQEKAQSREQPPHQGCNCSSRPLSWLLQ
jgi:hypothetical protein